jgi:biopolymer transport protein ExbB/TolQ
MFHEITKRLPRAFDPPFILAVLGTAAFNFVMHQPAMRDSMVASYTTRHAVEYVIVALFFWGLSDLLFKLVGFRKEARAQKIDWLPPRQGVEPVENAETLLEEVEGQPQWAQECRVGKRVTQALGYVVEKNSAEGHHEYLQQLAEQDAETTYTNYSLMRFAAGVSPVLGLIGTVVHFGTALSGIKLDQGNAVLEVVVGEMGTAFKTTTIALAAAITMMFAMFACERKEHKLIEAINRLVDRALRNRFEVRDASVTPFLKSIRSAHEDALGEIVHTLQGLVGTWTETLEAVFARFDRRQEQEAKAWQGALDVLATRHQAYDAGREDHLEQSLSIIDARQQRHLDELHGLLERTAAIRDDFAAFTQSLQNLETGDGKLLELQARLTDNLRVLNQTQQIDQALHGLTAAIHLLTARHRGVGPNSAAA